MQTQQPYAWVMCVLLLPPQCIHNAFIKRRAIQRPHQHEAWWWQANGGQQMKWSHGALNGEQPQRQQRRRANLITRTMHAPISSLFVAYSVDDSTRRHKSLYHFYTSYLASQGVGHSNVSVGDTEVAQAQRESLRFERLGAHSNFSTFTHPSKCLFVARALLPQALSLALKVSTLHRVVLIDRSRRVCVCDAFTIPFIMQETLNVAKHGHRLLANRQ